MRPVKVHGWVHESESFFREGRATLTLPPVEPASPDWSPGCIEAKNADTADTSTKPAPTTTKSTTIRGGRAKVPTLKLQSASERDEERGEEKLPDVAEAAAADATTTPDADAAANAAADMRTATTGADTHAVGFEGSRDRVIVVPKLDIRHMLFSDEGNAAVDGVWKTLKLTPIFLALLILSTLGSFIALVHGLDDKRWYWLVAGTGVWQWLNMLSTRNLGLLRRLLIDFDALFNIGNFLTASLCLGASFGFDERAIVFLLVQFPCFALSVLGDATMSDNDFKLRTLGFSFSVLLCGAVLLLDLGHLFKDTESIVLTWGTNGMGFTTIMNTTSSIERAPWDVKHHTNLRSVAATRFALSLAYLFVLLRNSITSPTECGFLQNSARRTVGEAQVSLAEPTEQEAPGRPGKSKMMTTLRSMKSLKRLRSTEWKKAIARGFVFSDFKLDNASEKAIEALGKDDEVVVLIPAKEFVIAHGPKRTLLYWLCRDAGMTKQVNGFLEDFKLICAYLGFFVLLSLLALTEAVEVVPYQLTWLSVLGMPAALRKLFKLNTEAMVLVLLEIDFWIPFVMVCLSTYFASASFGHEPAAASFCFTFVFSYTAQILLADADLAANVIKRKGTGAAHHVFWLMGAIGFTTLVTFGLFPRSENHEYNFHFIYNKGAMEVVSLCTQFMATPLLFMCKFIVKIILYPGRTIIIKMPLVRHVMKKSRLRPFLDQAQMVRLENGRRLSFGPTGGRAPPRVEGGQLPK